MQSPFVKRKLISDNILEDLKYDLSFEKGFAAFIVSSEDRKNQINLDIKSATSAFQLKPSSPPMNTRSRYRLRGYCLIMVTTAPLRPSLSNAIHSVWS